jgi:hypothetical protein
LITGGAFSIALRSDEEEFVDEFSSSTNGDFDEELESSSTRVDFVCGGIFYLLLCKLSNAASEGTLLCTVSIVVFVLDGEPGFALKGDDET